MINSPIISLLYYEQIAMNKLIHISYENKLSYKTINRIIYLKRLFIINYILILSSFLSPQK